MKYQYDRLLAAVLSLCLLAGLLAPAVRAEETVPETIQIATAEQLEALARDCRLDSWSVGRTVVVTEDIDLTGSDFAGIPTFGGTLEGQGHTIRGLNLTEEGSVQGLFRYLQQDARVQDLHVEGSVQPGGSRAVVGGLAGENAGTVSNCTFSGTVSGTRQIGGIAGTNTVTGIITGCTVNGSVYGDHFVGGMAGQNDGVISQCTNQAAINTTVNENEVNLKDLTVEDLLTTERASDITDIGGIAGGSAGVVRACINRGAVGYDHIGYNVGGIAGSQTGYIEGCVNYGTVHARKEGGGIVGQMEPSNVLQYSQDTLQQLQGELNTLQGLMNQATQDAAASSSEVTAQINDLKNRVDGARNAVDTLLQKVADGIDIGTQNLTLTTLADLTGQGNAGAGADVSGEGQGSASIDTEIEPSATPAPTETPAESPDPESTPTVTPSVTPEPIVTPTPVPSEPAAATPTPEPPVTSTEEPAVSSDVSQPADSGTETERSEEVHGRPPHRAPGLEIDTDLAGQGSGSASLDGAALADGGVSLDGSATLTVPNIELNNQDAITAARNSLSGSLTSIADGVEALNTNTGDHTQALIRDMEAITNQLNKIGNTLLGAAENAGQGTLFEDVSDEDTDGDTEGKVCNCLNAGAVYADLNAGGITGAMARENDLDPEDDTRISGSSSLNVTYKTRVVVRGCTNQGSVEAQKQCAGGIVGSMELGSVLQCCNTADLLLEDVDYVGGIAGQSKSILRNCASESRLAGNRCVGGIAGSGYTLTGCRAMVEATGTEKVGAVAGTLLAEDSLSNTLNQLQDNTGTVQDNCFVSDTLGGIDGVSYAGQAEPVPFADFATLAAQEGLPETFSNITITFTADGQTVAVIPVEYGSAFDMTQVPDIPTKEGFTAAWPEFAHDCVVFDQTVAAVYTPLATVLESAEQREDGRAVLLAEGTFAEGTLTVTALEDGVPSGTAESWQFTLPEETSGTVQLHYLPAQKEADLYLRGGDGSWRKVDTTADGSYLVCTLQPGDNALAEVPRSTFPPALALLVLPCAALVLLAVLAVAVRRRRAAKAKS